MDISARLKEERLKRGLKQQDLAEVGGVGLSTQKNYESDKSDSVPDARYLSRISKLVDVAYIISGERHSEEVREDRPTYIDAVEFDPAVAKKAQLIVEELRGVFDVTEEQRIAMAPYVYALLMMKNFGTSLEDIIRVMSEIGLPLKKEK